MTPTSHDSRAPPLARADRSDPRLEWLSLALECGHLAILDWDLASDAMVWSDATYRIAGYGPGEIEPDLRLWTSLIHPDDRSGFLRATEGAAESGGAVETAFRLVRQDGSTRSCTGRGRSVRDADGRVSRVLMVIEDTTELATAQKRHRALRIELLHRLRNMLAVIRSIVRRTADTADDVDDFAAHLEGRIGALARLQSLLSQHPEEGVDLELLLREELRAAAADEGRLSLRGPEVTLPPRTAQAMGLVLHELTMNAVKFGALGTQEGVLDIGWNIDLDRSTLSFDWRESGVRRAMEPSHRGFGTAVIEERLPYELGADVSYRHEDDGVSCRISVTLA